MDAHIACAACTVEPSSAAWTEEQRKFRELADDVRTVGETVERQASGIANFSEAFRAAGQAAPRPSALVELAPRLLSRVLKRSQTASRASLLKV